MRFCAACENALTIWQPGSWTDIKTETLSRQARERIAQTAITHSLFLPVLGTPTATTWPQRLDTSAKSCIILYGFIFTSFQDNLWVFQVPGMLQPMIVLVNLCLQGLSKCVANGRKCN
jgi:hypothetical protein